MAPRGNGGNGNGGGFGTPRGNRKNVGLNGRVKGKKCTTTYRYIVPVQRHSTKTQYTVQDTSSTQYKTLMFLHFFRFFTVDLRQQKNGTVYAEGLTRVSVRSPGDVQNVMLIGSKARSVGAHDFNAHSSRSHLVMTVTIVAESCNKPDDDEEGEEGEKEGHASPPPTSSAKQRVSRLHMIDLAGSERISKTSATGERLKEAQSINKSLSALGNVICALGKSGGGGHVPFRDSKLTHLLSNSLSGSSKVIMMLCVSPTQVCGPETLCSLKFASRCRATKLGRAKKKTMQRGRGSN